MRKHLWRATAILMIALALGIAGGDALAGKGGSKGKPGGGGGGGDDGGSGGGTETPPNHELVFVMQVEGLGCINCFDIASTNLDGSGQTMLTESDVLSVPLLGFDARGDAIAYGAYYDLEVLDLDFGVRVPINAKGSYTAFTRSVNSSGGFLAWDEQLIVARQSINKPTAGPSGTADFADVVLVDPADGSRVANLTNHQGTWDPATGIFHWTLAEPSFYVPQQYGSTDAESGRSWVFYRAIDEDWEYVASSNQWSLVESSIETQWRRITLDTSTWTVLANEAVSVPDTIGVWPAPHPYPGHWTEYPILSSNGLWAVLNRSEGPYIVKVDFSSGDAEIPEPAAAALPLPISPPNTDWESRVEVRAVSDDGETVAVNLWRTETQGKGKKRTTSTRRHLFVGATDGTNLIQVGQDLDLRRTGNSSYISAAFRPSSN